MDSGWGLSKEKSDHIGEYSINCMNLTLGKRDARRFYCYQYCKKPSDLPCNFGLAA